MYISKFNSLFLRNDLQDGIFNDIASLNIPSSIYFKMMMYTWPETEEMVLLRIILCNWDAVY